MNGEKIDWHNHPSSAQALGYTNGNAAAALYSSPAEFERERAAIFRRTWLIVGREEEVAEPGDYLSRHIPTVGASVVIARGKDAQWRPCRIEPLALKRVDDWLERYRRFWEQSLDRLEDYLHEVQAQEKSKAGKPKRPRKT